MNSGQSSEICTLGVPSDPLTSPPAPSLSVRELARPTSPSCSSRPVRVNLRRDLSVGARHGSMHSWPRLWVSAALLSLSTSWTVLRSACLEVGGRVVAQYLFGDSYKSIHPSILATTSQVIPRTHLHLGMPLLQASGTRGGSTRLSTASPPSSRGVGTT